MDLVTLRTAVEYHYWANRRIMGAIAGLSQEQFTKEIVSSFPSIQATLEHMLRAEAIWMGRFTGTAQQVLPAEVATAEAVTQRWEQLEQQYMSYLEGLNESELDGPVAAKFSDGRELTTRLWEALQHVVNHGTYHRGQLTMMLRQVGAQPVSTDMIIFYRERWRAQQG